jgi:hypothetical protein
MTLEQIFETVGITGGAGVLLWFAYQVFRSSMAQLPKPSVDATPQWLQTTERLIGLIDNTTNRQAEITKTQKEIGQVVSTLLDVTQSMWKYVVAEGDKSNRRADQLSEVLVKLSDKVDLVAITGTDSATRQLALAQAIADMQKRIEAVEKRLAELTTAPILQPDAVDTIAKAVVTLNSAQAEEGKTQ